jgi:hypothetical protein
VKHLNACHVFSLLTRGAGIYQRSKAVIADPRFKIEGPKAEHAATVLISELARRIALRGEIANLLVLFEDRPATLALGKMLASQLSQRWKVPVPVLSIKRVGKELELRYYSDSSSQGETPVLSFPEIRALVRNARVLIFSDLLRAGDHEGALRVLRAPAVHRYQVKVLGIATLAIAEAGTRKRFRKAVGNEQFPIHLLMHFGERLSEEASANSKKKGSIAAFLRKAFGGASAP